MEKFINNKLLEVQKMKNIKKMQILTVFTLMILMICQSVIGADNPTLKATLLRYEPTPAQPGGYMTVYLQIENIGAAPAKNVKIEFIDNYPFTVDNAADKVISAGLIGTGQTYIKDIRVRIDEKALPGINYLKFKITDPSIADMEKIFDVSVKSLKTDLTVKEIVVLPKELNPGDTGKISLVLRNDEDSTLTKITATLMVYTVSGSTAIDIPFAIDDSVSKKSINVIRAGEEAKIEYAIRSYPSISPGIYKLPLYLEFFDSSGENYTKTEFVSVVVNPKVDTAISIDKSDLTKQVKTGVITFKIVNKGLGQIQFANLKIGQSNDFDLLTPYNEIYVGNIDSDDYQTADFEITAKKDSLSIPVTLEFKDSLNKDHKIETSMALTLLSKSQNGQKSSNTWWIILLVVVIGASLFWYFKRKKKK